MAGQSRVGIMTPGGREGRGQLRGERVIRGQEREARVEIRGLGRAKRPSSEKGDFPDLERRCEGRTEEDQ